MRVSVAIPFLNSAATLEEAIRSVFSQSLADWELMLVDDGSTDASLEIARAIRDPRVRVISDGAQRGLVYRLNQAAQLARAPLLARMDADDIMHPERLAKQVGCLESNAHVEVVGSAAYIIGRDAGITGLRDPAERIRRSGWPFAMFVHPAVMARTSWFRANPYDPAYPRAEDTELWFRTRLSDTAMSLAEPLLYYRESGCFSLVKYRESARTVDRIWRRYGPEIFGRRRTWLARAEGRAKHAVLTVLDALGCPGVVMDRRSRPLNAAEWESARAGLARVRATAVPGWNAERVCA